ncbi:MAG: choice-of-anchor Q domain-containing protein, partial [Candidatus Rokuibacteriota bacterium]
MPRSRAGTLFEALVLLLVVTAGAPAASAAVVTLGACTPEGLRALIAGAAAGDVLLLPACTIPVVGAAGDDANLSGDFDIATSITLQGVGSDATILDGGGLDRVLDIRPGATVVIADLTIRNGAAPGGEDGGGIRNGGVLTLVDVAVSRNTAGGGGGGIASTGTLRVRRSRVTENAAGGTSGGGILCITPAADVLVEASTVAGNTANEFGGGLTVAFSTAVVRNSTVADNTSLLNGGGIEGLDDSTLVVEGTTVSGNATGTDGGGLRIAGGTIATIDNSTIVYNRSRGVGGGVSVGGTLTLVNSTIARNVDAGNSATGAGGVESDGTLSVRNSVIAENTVGPGTPNADVDVADLDPSSSNNLIGTVDGNPRLGPLQDNGGPTFTMAPFPGSPLIDTGDNALAAAQGLTTDQRGAGFARIVDGDGAGGATVDRGAVEVAASPGPANVALLFLSHLTPAPGDTVVLGILIRAPGRTIVGGAALFDGFDISAPLVGCPLLAGTVLSGEQVFTCTFPASLLPPGVHTFSLFLD